MNNGFNYLKKKKLGITIINSFMTDKTNPISYCLQHASLKSVTGDISACIGRPLNQRLFSFSTALAASFS